MTLVQLVRGVAACTQTAADTPAVPAAHNWLNWVTKASLKPTIGYDYPEFLIYKVWMEQMGIPTTILGEWAVEGYVDTDQIGWWFFSLDGTPTGTPPTFIWTPGATAARFLTLIKVNKALTTYRQIYNGVMTECKLTFDVKKGWMFAVKGIGCYSDNPSSPPTPSLPTPADKSPLRAFWTVATVAGAAAGVETFSLTLKTKATPVFQSPLVAPGAGAIGGVAPTDFEIDALSGEYDLKRTYGAYAGSDIANYVHDTAVALSVAVIDPVTSGGKGLTLTLPLAKAGSAEELDETAVSRQHTTGHFLYAPGSGSGAVLQLVNAGGGYAAS